MFAKTEPPKTHSPAAEAAHSPAEAPEPIAAVDRTVSRPYAIDAKQGAAFCPLASRTWIESRRPDRELSCGVGQTSGARRGCEISLFKDSVRDRRRIRNTQTESDAPDDLPGRRENTRDTLHGLLLAPLTVAVRTVPIPRRRRRDLPQLWRRQRRDEVRPTDVRVPPVVGNARPVGAGAP